VIVVVTAEAYRVGANAIEVVHVLHGARDLFPEE
jgi:hypothetical protein